MLTLSGERLKPSGPRRKRRGRARGNTVWDAKSTAPGVLFERCVLPRQGRLFGNFGNSKEARQDAQPLKGEHSQFLGK